MAHSLSLAVNLLDAKSLLSSFGTLGIAIVLFAETGLLVGLFLPGDSLLFTAGLLCATSREATLHLHLGLVMLAAAAGALVGAQTGYWLGRKAGTDGLYGPKPAAQCGGGAHQYVPGPLRRRQSLGAGAVRTACAHRG